MEISSATSEPVLCKGAHVQESAAEIPIAESISELRSNEMQQASLDNFFSSISPDKDTSSLDYIADRVCEKISEKT